MAGIELRRVEKRYPDGVQAVKGLDLEVEDGELLVLLGPSGCGKSTVLRLVAGLETPTEGEIWIGDRRVDGIPPQRRNVAMVFQNYALYAHMSVRGNLEFPLRMRGVPTDERARRAEEVAGLLELTEVLDARPGSLSGGQQQRVAMGRALVREPDAFLLDEPLSNLDARLRSRVRREISDIQARLGVTTVHVTHDQVEAMSLGHRIAVLHAGRLQQVGGPHELYDAPANVFVASFLGQPGMNLLRGRLEREDGVPLLNLGVVKLPMADSGVGARAGPVGGFPEDGRVVLVGVRPEAIHLAPEGSDDLGAFNARVRNVEALGSEDLLYVEASFDRSLPDSIGYAPAAADSDSVLVVRTRLEGPRPRVGDLVRLSLQAEDIHVFDLSGLSLER